MHIARFSSPPLVRLSRVRRLYVLILLPSVFLPHLQSICCPCLSRSSCLRFSPSSGHRGHTPGSHFSEGRTWIPFPLHNDGKLHRLHHACVFESNAETRRCYFSAEDSWLPDDAFRSDGKTRDGNLGVCVRADHFHAFCRSCANVTFESPTLACLCLSSLKSSADMRKPIFSCFYWLNMLLSWDLQILLSSLFIFSSAKLRHQKFQMNQKRISKY